MSQDTEKVKSHKALSKVIKTVKSCWGETLFHEAAFELGRDSKGYSFRESSITHARPGFCGDTATTEWLL